MSGVPAGALRTMICHQRPVDSKGTAGGRVRTWRTVANRWARVMEGGGKELRAGGRVLESGEVLVELRAEKDIREGDRFTVQDSVLEIEAVLGTDANTGRVRVVARRRRRQVLALGDVVVRLGGAWVVFGEDTANG